MEFQLPGGPAKWEPSASRGLAFLRVQVIASPGRIPGTDNIYQFRYLLAPGIAGSKEGITFRENPQVLTRPVGSFTYTIMRR